MKGLSLAVAAGALFASSVSAAVDPIVIKGNKFFYKTNGTQFYMRGVAYQQGISTNTSQTETLDFIDPLADSKTCTRDIAFLAKLRTNTIRVYALDPKQNHDDCMTALANAGIYVIADLSQPGESINREDAGWTTALYERYTSVVDMMQKYDNTLGFFAGNEVSNQPNNTEASAFVKAAVRDTKAYIKAKGYRTIGVGYATNDDADIRENLANYFDCGNREEAIDFWGYNIYSWCGDSSFQKSGYDVRTQEFEKFDVPVFFAEYGCNQVQPRKFTEVQALYGSQMNDIWSGGIVYMYFQEENDFGLVSIDGSGAVKTNDDFVALSSQIAKVNPTGVKMADFNPTNTAAASCPSVGTEWGAAATPLPPVANTDLCSCMNDGLSCVVSSDVDEKDYGKIFGFVCGEKNGAYCAGIAKNATTGAFGAYGMCTPQQQLNYVLDQYSRNNTNGGCNFQGQAKSATPKSASSSCKSLLEQAGPQGTGTVTSAPGAAQTGKGSQGAAPGLLVPSFSVGLFSLGVYVFGTGLAGAAMVLL